MNTISSTTDNIGHGYASWITEMAKELRQWASGLSEDTLYIPPASGEWTVAENLVHVVEFLPYWAEQLHHVVEAPGEPFGRTHEDADRIASVEDHAHDELRSILASIEEAANRASRDLVRIPDSQWETTGLHRRGEMTLHEITDFFLVAHLAEHLAQAKQAAADVDESSTTTT